MARVIHQLSDVAIRNAKPADRPYKLADGRGLYLLVTDAGSKHWRLKYRVAGREKLLALGSHPEVSLKQARQLSVEARAKLVAGVDPSAERQRLRVAAKASAENSFKAVADGFLRTKAGKLAPATMTKNLWIIDKLLSNLHRRPVSELEAPELLQQLRRIESLGRLESAHRALSLVSQVFRFAIASGLARRNPAADLRGALVQRVSKNRPAITEAKAVGALMRAIWGYRGQPASCAALRLLPLVVTRPGELRQARWSEFTLEGDAPAWLIPTERMKMRRPHFVPLSRQAVAILEDLRPFTERGPESLVFPSNRHAARPLSENTLNACLRGLGYDTQQQHTAHGFRATFSTIANELGWSPDVVERALAHQEKDDVRAAYNRAQHLEERRQMLQQWADYLDGLRHETNVVPIGEAKRRKVVK